MREKTLRNVRMGYSAAYHTGAERCLFSRSRESKSNRGGFVYGFWFRVDLTQSGRDADKIRI